jgi:hypothetical protein
MKKKILILLMFCISFFEVQGQNLVPNGSFEDTLRCSTDSIALTPRYWYSPSCGSPDFYYPTNDNPGCLFNPMPWQGWTYQYNPFGHQSPHSGLGYVGTRTLDEFIAIKLSDTLRTGWQYCVEAYVSLADSAGSGLDLVQFSFTKTPISNYDINDTNFWHLDSTDVEAQNQNGNLLIDTANWMLVSDSFTAHGGEQYLIIGNFDYDTLETQYQVVNPVGYTYYFFDDISVYACGNPAGIEPNILSNFAITPNPSNGEFILKGNFTTESTIEIYDMLGEKLSSEEIPKGNQSLNLRYDFSTGIYLYKIISSGQELKTGKLIIAK